MTGSPVPTKDPIVEGERNLLSRIWVRFFQDLIKDVASYAAHASRHLTGGSDEVDGDKLDIDWTPSNYTPSTSPSEANNADNLTAHLKGVDTVLGTISSHASAHITGGSDEVDGDKLDIDWNATNYTPSTSPSQATSADNLTAHLKGIDTLLGIHASRHITGAADEIDADKADIDWTPTNYTPSTSPSEVDNVDNLTAHLKGIDVAIATKASTDHDAGHVTGGSDEIDGDKLDIDWTPTNYTPSTSPSEADNVDNLTAHLKGIDAETALMLKADGSRALSGRWDMHADVSTDRWDDSDTNTFFGVGVCGAGNLSGATNSTFIGNSAGNAITSGADNTCIGYQAGDAITTGYRNLFIGSGAGSAVTQGHSNVGAGYQSLFSETIGDKNVGIGYRCGYYQSNANENMLLGYRAGYYNVTGGTNVIIGADAGYGAASQSHSSNVFIGRRAGYVITTGGNNICIGLQAGDVITTGSGNIVIGYDIDPSAANATNEINIGGVYKGDTSTTVPQFGTHTVNVDAAITGYITIKDLAGNDRKLAVID